MDNPSTLERDSAPRFPAEDSGRSLAAMAYRDLDAALQLLAERAQYITGATGAVIALRRGDHNDMLCRASAGPNAPELGALLSMEYGFSGESVRTRQAIRCDDSERDPRVNREGCRRLGISSVVAMPILSDHQILGVFELFSGKTNAFTERDLAALQRLGEMVETAVKYAVAAQAVPELLAEDSAPESAAEVTPPIEPNPPVAELASPPPNLQVSESGQVKKSAIAETKEENRVENKLEGNQSAQAEKVQPVNLEVEKIIEEENREAIKLELKKIEATPAPPSVSEKPSTPAPPKPLFWTAPTHQPEPSAAAPQPSAPVPPTLQTLHKCQACGFPVSQGRTLCVECEEKKWRGQPVPKPVTAAAKPAQPEAKIPAPKPILATAPAASAPAVTPSPSPAQPESRQPQKTESETPLPAPQTFVSDQKPIPDQKAAATAPLPQSVSTPESPTLFLASTVESQSWLSANKYILAVLILVALMLAAFALLH